MNFLTFTSSETAAAAPEPAAEPAEESAKPAEAPKEEKVSYLSWLFP